MANSKRGFAAMDPQKQRQIASEGGQSQGQENNPSNFANDPEKASEAGRKGGSASGNANELRSESGSMNREDSANDNNSGNKGDNR